MNAPIDLNLLRAFAAVHAAGSFSAAAATLGVPRSTVSRAVAALEERLKQPLFQRTTRKVTTTPVGVSLFERVAPQLDSLTGALFDLPQQTDAPSGTLRVTATVDLGIMVLTEVIARYLRRYPGTQVEVDLTARVVDMVREGFDLALRVSPKRQKSSSLIARKVGHVLFQLYASPAYLARRPAPRSLEEVSEHEWVTYDSRPFTLTHTRGNKRVVVPSARVMGNDMMFQREALRAGCGLGPLPSFVADADVANGVLVRVLPDWVAISAQVLLVHPPQRHLPPKVSAFQQLLLEMLRQRPISPGVS
ncbi:MAG TPA: LysR family transcriptional regulator [Polyangiaceae bacterium]|nr:LysR family transcriptional regulator [Polyangiaceae bacterium]